MYNAYFTSSMKEFCLDISTLENETITLSNLRAPCGTKVQKNGGINCAATKA